MLGTQPPGGGLITPCFSFAPRNLGSKALEFQIVIKENLPSSRGTFVLDGGCPWKVSGDGLEQDRAVLLCLNLHLLISCKTPLMDKLQMVSLSPSKVR